MDVLNTHPKFYKARMLHKYLLSNTLLSLLFYLLRKDFSLPFQMFHLFLVIQFQMRCSKNKLLLVMFFLIFITTN